MRKETKEEQTWVGGERKMLYTCHKHGFANTRYSDNKLYVPFGEKTKIKETHVPGAFFRRRAS